MSSKLAVWTSPDRIKGLLQNHCCRQLWLLARASLLRLPPRGEAFPPPTGNTFSRKTTSKHKQNAGWEWMGVQKGLNVTKPGVGFPLAKNPSKLALLPNCRFLTSESHGLATKMYLATGCFSARQTCQAGREQSKDAWQLEDLEG